MSFLLERTPPQSLVGSLGEPAPARRPDEARIDDLEADPSLPIERPECEPGGRRASPTLTYTTAAVLLATSGILAIAAWRSPTVEATRSLGTLGAVAGLLGLCALGAGMVAEMLWAERERVRGEVR